ncbi:unnamed protein product [Boreogadus saida]
MDFPMRQFTIIRVSPGLPLQCGYTGTMEATTLVLLVLLDCLLVSVMKGPALCLDFQRGAAFYTFQKGPALYLPFPRGSAIQTFQTFQKGPSLYLAFVFADASTSPSSSPMPATCFPPV